MLSIITPAQVQYSSDSVRDFEMRLPTIFSVLLIWPLVFGNNIFSYLIYVAIHLVWIKKHNSNSVRIVLLNRIIRLVLYLYACILILLCFMNSLRLNILSPNVHLMGDL